MHYTCRRKSTNSDMQLNHTSARHWISTNPFAVLKGLSKTPTAAELHQAHLFWVNRETRRRLLLGSFILDTQQSVLFEQQLVLFPKWPTETFSSHISTLPWPCNDNLWECKSAEKWAELSSPYENILLPAASVSTYNNPNLLDPFRSRLVLTYLSNKPSPNEGDSDIELTAFCKKLTKLEPSVRYAATEFDIHAHIALQHIPIRSLLIVSGESWLFGKKLENQDDFHSAKSQLRDWTGSSNAQTALWHASALLRMVFHPEPDTVAQSADDGGATDRTMGMLHEQWCVYIAGLICWACAFDKSALPVPLTASSTASPSVNSPAVSGPISPAPSMTGYPSLIDPVEADAEMRHFLHGTAVGELEDLPAALAELKGQTRGLLEVVRTRKINGALGGLLNEASGVLYRLVEGRSRLSHF
jgi:Fungal specific transcription factor domain